MADVARIRLVLEAEVASSYNRAFADAKRQRDDFIRDSERAKPVELKGDASPIEKTISGVKGSLASYKKESERASQINLTADDSRLRSAVKAAAGDISSFKKTANKEGSITLSADNTKLLSTVKDSSSALNDLSNQEVTVDADNSPLLSAVKSSRSALDSLNDQRVSVSVDESGTASTTAALERLRGEAKAADEQDVRLDVDASGVKRGVASANRELDKFSKQSAIASVGTNDLSERVNRLGGASSNATPHLNNLATSIRSIGTVTIAAAGIPAIVAAIGALPAVALAAAGAAGQLGLALGQGMAGALVIGQAAFQSSRIALLAYKELLSSTVTASRELYLEENKAAQARIDAARKTAFSTQANVDFNRSLDDSQIALIKLQGAVANRVFPMFTKEIRAWGPIFQRNKGEIVDTAGSVAGAATMFSKWFRTADDGKVLNRTIGFINDSAGKGAQALLNIGATGVLAFQKVIPAASKLQTQIVGLARSMFAWTNSAKGASTIEKIVATLQHRMYQLLSVVKNVGSGLIGVFTAINNTGGPDRLMAGLVNLSKGFANLMQRGNGARAAIVGFMRHADPLLNQLWKLVKTVVIQFGLLAKSIIEAGQQNGKMGTLAKVVASVRKSVTPLRKMFQQTFKALGPVLANLIPQVAKFASVFLGSSGPLKVFLESVTTLLRIFNRLPDGVKTTIANLVALKVIIGGLGLGALVRGIKDTTLSMLALKASGSGGFLKGAALGIVGVARSLGILKIALIGTGIGAALVALGVAGVLIYKNWSRIKRAVEPATKAIGGFLNAIRPVVAALRGALFRALKSVVGGFLDAVAPSLKLGKATKGMSTAFGMLAKRAIPPVVHGLNAVTNFVEGHQGAFRLFGRIVGTVLVSGFRVWGVVIRTTVKLITGLVKVVARIIQAFRSAAKGVSSASGTMRKTVGNMTSGMMKAIRSFGSAFLKAWRTSIWGRAASFLVDRARGMLQTLNNWKNSAVKWVKSLVGAIYNFWKNRIWDPIAKFLMNRADGMMQTLGNWKNRAVSWVHSLISAIYNFWKNRIWDPIAKFLVNRADGMMQTLGNWKDRAVGWVKSLPGTIGRLWHDFWQGMADWVVSKKEGILQTMWNMVAGVKNAWKSMAEFTNKILTTLGLKEGDTKPIPSPGPTQGTINAPGGVGGTNRPGAARGGLTSGTQADAYKQFDLYQMARGGQPPRGGMADGKQPRLVYGEAGPEAYVTLGRYTKESAKALTKANEVWSKKGWLEKARRERTNRGGAEEDLRPGGKWGQGYSVSPITHYEWAPEITDRVHAIANATGTKPNTYPGHGEPGGSTEKYTADFWGPGGRGSPISKSAGYKTADLAINKYNHDPGVLYVIRQGEYWRGGHWQSNTYGDPHFDHTHVSWDSPGGAHAEATMRPNPKQEKFEDMWHKTIDPWGKKWVARMSPASQLHRGAGAGTSKGVGSIYDWIDAKIPDMIGGGSLPGGSSPKGLTIGEALEQGGWPDSQLIKGSSTIWHESRGNAHAQNPSGARGLMQIMPQTAKGVGASYDKLYDPIYNTSTGLKVYNQAGGWGPWVGAGMGGDYRNKKVTGYRQGGIVPGLKGKPVLIQAHAGEMVLPERLTRSFQRLARAIDRWSDLQRRARRHAHDGVDLPGDSPQRGDRARTPHAGLIPGVNVRGVHDRDPLNIRKVTKNWDEHVEHAVAHMRREIVKELKEQKHRMIDADDLLQAALRVQDSPAGRAGHARRNNQIIHREKQRLGSKKKGRRR